MRPLTSDVACKFFVFVFLSCSYVYLKEESKSVSLNIIVPLILSEQQKLDCSAIDSKMHASYKENNLEIIVSNYYLLCVFYFSYRLTLQYNASFILYCHKRIYGTVIPSVRALRLIVANYSDRPV
jgi:hypothetical protein